MDEDEIMSEFESALRHIIHVAAGADDLSDEVEDLIAELVQAVEDGSI